MSTPLKIVAGTEPRRFTFTFGKNERTQTGWKSKQLSLAELQEVCTTYRIGEKSGPSFVPGEIVGDRRVKTAVRQITALVFDLDGMVSFEVAELVFDTYSYPAFGYSTHSDGATKSYIKTDTYAKWATKTAQPPRPDKPRDAADFVAFLNWQGKSRYSNVRFDPEAALVHTTEGISYTIEHDPVDRLRVVVPLAEPIVLSELSHNNAEACEELASIIRGAAAALSLMVDESCTDPSRLFFRPAHPPGKTPRTFISNDGPLFDWRSVTRVYKAKGSSPASKTKADKSAVPPDSSGSPLTVTDRTGRVIDVETWNRRHRDFAMADMFAEKTDLVLAERPKGGYFIRCHNDGHSPGGEEKTWVDNPRDDKPWAIGCSGDACADTPEPASVHHLAAFIRAGLVTADDMGYTDADDEFADFASAGEQQWLAKLNKKFALVKHGSKVVVADFTSPELITFMQTEAFQKLYLNKYAPKRDEDEEGKRKPMGGAWLKHPGRREYICGVVFDPGKAMEPARGVLNLWRGFGVKPVDGDWSLMKDHILDVICAGDQAQFEWTLGWMAMGVQKLDCPLGIALALRGKPGAGKGTMVHQYGKLFAPHYLHLSKPKELVGTFNAGLGSAVCVFLDEALFAGDKEHEGVLKALITEPTLRVEPKFLDAMTAPNRLRLIIASNNSWIVPVGTEDRRFAVFDVSEHRAGDYAYFDRLIKQMDGGGLAAMMHDLLAMDLRGFEVRNIPGTAARSDQMVRTLSGPRKWLYSKLQDGEIGAHPWEERGLEVTTAEAYSDYLDFSKNHREYQPAIKDTWSRAVRTALPDCVGDHRPGGVRHFIFQPLAECRVAFAKHIGATDLDWGEGAEAIKVITIEDVM